MRVFHIIAGGRHGGAETFFVDLVDALARRGVEQHAFTRPNVDRLARLTNASCTVSTGRLGGPLDLVSPMKLRRSLTAAKPDVVLAWMNRAGRYTKRGPWVTVGRLGGYYNLKYYKQCDHLICNTPDLVRHCVDHGWDPTRVDYIPNFSPQVECDPVTRASLSTPEQATVLLVLARLEQQKGVDIAIQVLRELPDAHLWIAGTGSQKKILEALAVSQGVHAQVRFLDWRHDREALLKAADVCLVPSRHEPFGNVVINAWTSGTPVVAAASEGPSFLIENGVNGVLTPIDEAGAMAKAIDQITSDSGFAQRLVVGGQAKVADTFSENSVTTAYIELFERIMAQRC